MQQTKQPKQLKIRYKLSFSPSKEGNNQLALKTKINKKTSDINTQQVQMREKILEACRGISNIVHKNRHISTGLFKNAHKIEKRQTFLSNEKKYTQSHTNQSSSPKTHLFSSTKINRKIYSFNNVHSTNSMKLIKSNNDVDPNKIQRTISIKIDGSSEEEKNNKELVTTLSRLIFDQDGQQDNFQLQFIDQSSIHGDEQNYIELEGISFQHPFLHH